MELSTFLGALSPEILVHYRGLYLQRARQGDAADEREAAAHLSDGEIGELAEALATKLQNRRWVREQLKKMPRSRHAALVALLQTNGIAGGTWLLQELTSAHGMSEDLWAEVMHSLGEGLWVFGNSHQSPPLFYVLPAPLLEVLSLQFGKRLGLRSPQPQGELRTSQNTNYRYPLAYSLVSLLTWIRQHRVRVTQAGEVFKKTLDEMVEWFGPLWGGEPDKVLEWQLRVVQDLSLAHHRGGFLTVDEDAVAEYLALQPADRRDLVRASFVQTEPLVCWLLKRFQELPEDHWVPVDRVRMVYRRRYMGQVFHRRYVRKSYYLPPSGFYDPTPPLEVLQVAGLIESGLGSDGSFVRLSEAGRIFMGEHPGSSEANPRVRFLMQPTFEVLAPVGLPLKLLWDLGQVAQLQKVDRASSYLLTRDSVRGALDDGWRASDVRSFLVNGSTVPLSQNVSSTLDDWVGAHGEVELHDALVVTVQPARLATLREVFNELDITHEALAETVFAVPRERREELLEALRRHELDPARRVRLHDLANHPATRQGPLRTLLAAQEEAEASDAESIFFPARSLVMLGAPSADGGHEAMSQRSFRSGRSGANRVGADLSLKPAAAGAGDLLRLSPAKTMSVVRAAIRRKLDLEVLYPSTGEEDPGGISRVTPTEVREAGGASWFKGRCHRRNTEVTYRIKRIQGIRLAN